MMWWDRLVGTYKSPDSVRQFNSSSETYVQGGSHLVVGKAREELGQLADDGRTSPAEGSADKSD